MSVGAKMTALVARSMEAGAWGLVTRFESGGPERPEETIAMAKTVAGYGGNYTSHVGSEGFEQTREIDFAIRTAAQAKLPVHISTFKIRGRDLWGTIDRYIAPARARTEKNKIYEGKRVSEIATLRGDADPMDTCIDLMAEEGGAISGVVPHDVRGRRPHGHAAAVASDGAAINLDAPGVPHPRNYASNVRVLGHYVRDQQVLALPEAVRKMTGLPAAILGLKDRGLLKAGYAADVVMLDPARVGETNSFEAPTSYAVGVPFVLVNGTVVTDRGEPTGARPGRVLRGPGCQEPPSR